MGILQLQGTGMVVAYRNVERTLFHEFRCVAQSVGAFAPAVHAVLRGCIHHFFDAALGFTRTDRQHHCTRPKPQVLLHSHVRIVIQQLLVISPANQFFEFDFGTTRIWT